ncbi:MULTISPECIES: hypothetical protein [Micrococcaceae]|uniref:hypothetical protein n=1 Tax=Micrococcaceae TaxID=1268 RepID=UPI000BB762DF|nr:hypothetical protein [Glutamicibacter sp. BW78]PCC26473.1 hypothetical protein CIK75_02940 [Glutamicibacter sp. BW78]
MKTSIKISALAFAGALALTGCNGEEGGPDSSTPASTPVSSSSPSASAGESSPGAVEVPESGAVTTKPVSEEVAVDAAFETVERLWAVTDAQSADGSTSMKRVRDLAVDPYRTKTQKYLKLHASKKGTATGERSVELVDGFTTPMTYKGKKLKFHNVQMNVCNDTSGIEYKANGKKAKRPSMERTLLTVMVQFDPGKKQWFVTRTKSDEEPQKC